MVLIEKIAAICNDYCKIVSKKLDNGEETSEDLALFKIEVQIILQSPQIPAEKEETHPRCLGTTKAGVRCNNRADSAYCFKHQSQIPKKAPKQNEDDDGDDSEEVETCKYIYTSGNQCTRKTTVESPYCYTHKKIVERKVNKQLEEALEQLKSGHRFGCAKGCGEMAMEKSIFCKAHDEKMDEILSKMMGSITEKKKDESKSD